MFIYILFNKIVVDSRAHLLLLLIFNLRLRHRFRHRDGLVYMLLVSPLKHKTYFICR